MELMEYIRGGWAKTTRQCRENLDGNIALPYPYVVPCIEGGFHNLFYWDSFFAAQGMLLHGQEALVKSTVDDMLYLTDRCGYMPNGNSESLMGRSQPPFLSEMVRQVYEAYHDPVWLCGAYRVLKKEYHFWMTERLLPCGLNRYGFALTQAGIAKGMEVAKRLPGLDFSGMSDARIAENVMADAESGWDFSPRCELHQTEFAYVDLNSILYVMEKNMERFAQILCNHEENVWQAAAHRRRTLMNRLLDDGEIYRDWNNATGEHSPIFSVASFYPLWAGVATKEQADRTVGNLPRLECAFGIAACEKGMRKTAYQWDYPNGWAPLHFIMVHALDRYGYQEDALRIARKYTASMERIFRETGMLWEKHNVVDGSLNVTDEYKMPPMLGWTAGVYADLMAYQGNAQARNTDMDDRVEEERDE